MPLTQDETMKNIGLAFTKVGEAMEETSDGGVKVTLSEIVAIFTEVGVNVVNDMQD